MDSDPHGKEQVAIGFFRNTGMDPLEKQLGPSELLLEGMGPIASRGRSVRLSRSVKNF